MLGKFKNYPTGTKVLLVGGCVVFTIAVVLSVVAFVVM